MVDQVHQMFDLLSADIDECAGQSPCDPNALCTNTLGSFTCECNPGYSGDGMTCYGRCYMAACSMQALHHCPPLHIIIKFSTVVRLEQGQCPHCLVMPSHCAYECSTCTALGIVSICSQAEGPRKQTKVSQLSWKPL